MTETLCTVAGIADVTADAQRRIITGLALPYGVQGRTNRGAVTVEPGAIAIPSDLKRVKLYRDHRRPDGTGTPVGYVATASDTPNGLALTFKVGSGADGDLALTDASEGIRDGLSVELSGVRLSPDGTRVLAATLDAVALVAIPAFADARVHTVQAASGGPDHPTTQEDTMPEITEPAADLTASATTPAPEPTEAPAVQVPSVAPAPAAAPFGLHAARTEPRPMSLAQVCETLQAARQGDTTLHAALADITRSANPWVSPDGWVGEVWSGVAYQRVVVPLLNTGALTHWKLTGWRWVTKPEVDDYAGNKTEVPTNAPTTEAVSVEAKRLAGAHDIDRKFFDFNDQEFIASYFAAMAESYAYESDQRAAAFVIASATAAGSAPTLLKAVAKGRTYLKTNARARASYVLVNPTDMEALLDLTNDDVPAYLDLLGIEPRNFVDSEFVPAGTVVVGARPAATFYELAGSPIRVEAVDLARGGRDGALFGYYATLLHNAKGIAKVTVTPAP
ncbi:phage major capsid protein [Nocardia goodfellowii]